MVNISDTTTNAEAVRTAELSSEDHVYVILTAVTSSLSIVGGSLICVIYFLFKDLQTPSRKLLFFVAFSDALLAFGNLLGIIWFLYADSAVINRNEGYCKFQSAMTIYFSYTSFFWTVTMALCLFMSVVICNSSFTATYMKVFHILAWAPMGIILVVALGMGVLGTDTSLQQASWCWIDPRVPYALLWQLITGKFFEMVAYVTTVGLYTAIRLFLGRQALKKRALMGSKKSRADVIAEANRKLMFVPLVFIVCRIWGTLRFLLGNFAYDVRDEPYVTWINPLQGIGDSAQGIANFVLYCYSTERIRRRIRRHLCPRVEADDSCETRLESVSRVVKKSAVGIAPPDHVPAQERGQGERLTVDLAPPDHVTAQEQEQCVSLVVKTSTVDVAPPDYLTVQELEQGVSRVVKTSTVDVVPPDYLTARELEQGVSRVGTTSKVGIAPPEHVAVPGVGQCLSRVVKRSKVGIAPPEHVAVPGVGQCLSRVVKKSTFHIASPDYVSALGLGEGVSRVVKTSTVDIAPPNYVTALGLEEGVSCVVKTSTEDIDLPNHVTMQEMEQGVSLVFKKSTIGIAPPDHSTVREGGQSVSRVLEESTVDVAPPNHVTASELGQCADDHLSQQQTGLELKTMGAAQESVRNFDEDTVSDDKRNSKPVTEVDTQL